MTKAKKSFWRMRAAAVLSVLFIGLNSAVLSFAVSVTGLDDSLGLTVESDGVASWSATGTSITASGFTGTSSGSWFNQKGYCSRSTLTITNSSGSDILLSFNVRADVDADGKGSDAWPGFSITNGHDDADTLDGSTTALSKEWQISGSSHTKQACAGGEYSGKLPAGESMTISITSPAWSDRSMDFYVTDIEVVGGNSKITVSFLPSYAGSYSVGETSVTSKIYQLEEVDPTVGVAVSAPAISGYTFDCWVDSDTMKVLSRTPSTTLVGLKDQMKIKPIYVKTDAGYVFQVLGGSSYCSWESAFDAAGPNGTVYLKGDYTLPASLEENGLTSAGDYVTEENGVAVYSIGENQTFVLPYKEGETTVEGTDAEFPYANYAAGTDNPANTHIASQYDVGDVYVNLTVGYGREVRVKGVLSIGGYLESVMPNSGFTMYNFSTINNHGTIRVKNGGVLSSCGFIYDDNPRQTGVVIGEAGSHIYEPFVIPDFRGASYTTFAAGGAAEVSGGAAGFCTFVDPPVFPTQQFTSRNIQCKLILEKENGVSAKLTGYVVLFTAEGAMYDTVKLVADDAIIILTDGATFTRTHDRTKAPQMAPDAGHYDSYADVGKNRYVIDGGASMGELTLVVELKISILSVTGKVRSSQYAFPVGYAHDFVLTNGDYSIDKTLALLPGARMTVAEDASLTIGANGSLSVLDGFDDSKFHWGNVDVDYDGRYPTSENIKTISEEENGAANLFVDGELHINGKFGGIIQTNAAHATKGARINVGSSAVLTTTTHLSANGKGKIDAYIASREYTYSGGSTHTITGRLYDSATGELMPMVTNGVYYAAPGRNILGTYTQLTSGAETILTLNAPMKGTWWVSTASKPVWVVDKEKVVGFDTLEAAIAAHNAVSLSLEPYIQLNPVSPVFADGAKLAVTSAVFNEDTVLDLNGCGISGTAAVQDGSTLYGMDSSSNGFLQPTGTVQISGNVAAVTTLGKMSYVAIGNNGTYQFHRFAVTPSALGFYFVPNGHSHLAVQATVQGTDSAVGKVQDLGFYVNDAEYWYGSVPAFGESSEKNISFIAVDYAGSTGYDTEYTFVAQAAFDAEKSQIISGEAANPVSMQTVLEGYYLHLQAIIDNGENLSEEELNVHTVLGGYLELEEES